MKVVNRIDVAHCNRILNDPARLAALDSTNQLNSARIETLDRITRLAARILNVPLTIVSLIGNENHFFKSFHGLPEPWASNPVIPIDNSVCRYSLAGDVLSLSDVRSNPLLADNPAVPALNLVAYLGVPLIDPDGHNLGAFCAIEYRPRQWSESDIEVMKDLTAIVMSELHLQQSLAEMKEAHGIREKAIALVAHDLRNPIAAIKGYADAMALIPEKEFQDEAISVIQRLSAKSIEMMESYLNQSVDSKAAVGSERQRIRVEDAIRNAIVDLELVYGKFFDFHCGCDDAEIYFDPQDFVRALDNLANNALKYGVKGEKVRISATRPSPEELAVSVHNFGNHLTQDEIDLLALEGKRTKRAQESKTKGWGLGLEFVKNVLKENQARLEIKSSKESGTTFSMVFSSIDRI